MQTNDNAIMQQGSTGVRMTRRMPPFFLAWIDCFNQVLAVRCDPHANRILSPRLGSSYSQLRFTRPALHFGREEANERATPPLTHMPFISQSPSHNLKQWHIYMCMSGSKKYTWVTSEFRSFANEKIYCPAALQRERRASLGNKLFFQSTTMKTADMGRGQKLVKIEE